MKEKYLLDSDKFYNLHLMLTNFCNSRCTYCQQFVQYGGDDVPLEQVERLVNFFSCIPREKKTFFLEGGEPSFYKKLDLLLSFFSSDGQSVVILTNGRIPKEKYDIFGDYLEKGTIRYLGLHVPIGKEPFHTIWIQEITSFLVYLKSRGIEKKIVYLGLLYDKNLTFKEILEIFRFHRLFPHSTLGMSFCFPHPNKLGRNHIDFNGRISLMKFVGEAYKFMVKSKIMPIFDGTLPCIIPNSSDFSFLKNFLCSKRTDISRNLEIHIDTALKANLISNLSDTSYITSQSIFTYGSFDNFASDLNKEIISLYDLNFSRMPEECKKCEFFLKGCSGDHFKLISNKVYAS